MWDEKFQESFEIIKSLLTQALILTLPIKGKDYVVSQWCRIYFDELKEGYFSCLSEIRIA